MFLYLSHLEFSGPAHPTQGSAMNLNLNKRRRGRPAGPGAARRGRARQGGPAAAQYVVYIMYILYIWEDRIEYMCAHQFLLIGFN